MLTKYKEYTKSDFERMIKEHGGSYSQHPGSDSEIHLIAEDASSNLFIYCYIYSTLILQILSELFILL